MASHLQRAIRVWPLLLALLAGACGTGPPKAAGPEPREGAGPAAVRPLSRGERLYERHCLSCHQKDGRGVPGMYPPVAAADWVAFDPDWLIRIMLNGMSGPIMVNGILYKNEMPGYPYLSDSEIADILTFIRGNFGNTAGPVTPEQVAAVRARESP